MVQQRKRGGGGGGGGDCRKTHSDFMLVVSDDLLREIFLRLPLGLDLIRCSAVCKRWFSLISDSDRQFIHTFTQYHRKQPSSDHSILFRYSPENSQPFHHLRFTNRSSPITASRNDHLDFLPKWPDVVVRASCQDLLLVSSEGELYVCNPLTRQWFSLPKVVQLVRNEFTVYGLVREPGCDNNIMDKFKVVMIYAPFFIPSYFIFTCSVFCSDTGLWTRRLINLPNMLPRQAANLCLDKVVADVVVTREGVMYWLEGGESEFKAAASAEFIFGSSSIPTEIVVPVRGRLISLPDGFSRRRVQRPRCNDRVCLGLVRGQVHLAQLVGVNQACLVLKVWELADSAWLLVHKKSLLKRESRVVTLLAFHPDDRNAIFIIRDREICEFKVEEGECKSIGKLPGDESMKEIKKRVSKYLKVFTLEHPLWPTIIPKFPSIQS